MQRGQVARYASLARERKPNKSRAFVSRSRNRRLAPSWKRFVACCKFLRSLSLSLSLPFSLATILPVVLSSLRVPRVRQLDFVVEKSRCCNLDPRLVAFIAIFRISIIQWKSKTMEIVAVAGKSGRARSIFLRSPYSSYLRACARAILIDHSAFSELKSTVESFRISGEAGVLLAA